jgi:hypothetical protein
MFDKETRMTYPISWITESRIFMEYLESHSSPGSVLLIADFASGEHDRVPSFFLRILRGAISPRPTSRWVIYSIDIHPLRLDSLLGTLEEEALLSDARAVLADLYTMGEAASIRPSQVPYLHEHGLAQTWLDRVLLTQKHLPPDSFDIGILNNDVIGYLHGYYKTYGEPELALKRVYETVKDEGLLIVTMPCSLYRFDSIQALEDAGFSLLQAIDIDTASGHMEIFRSKPPETGLSQLGHYSFFLFTK